MSLCLSKDDQPLVSVIVPARNEEASLAACLTSLTAQKGVKHEIIVVDDGSTDATRQIAGTFAGVQIVSPGPLPAGWGGKNNALVAGAKIARAQWLLFTDADTIHHAGSLARALSEAKHHGASMLSYSPEQEVHGILQHAVMPVIFAELAATFRPAEVSESSNPIAAANGQYILISREVYDWVGGHAAVAESLLEDVALATAVKSAGHTIFFRYGADAVSTRMYRSFAQLKEGWTKNLALLFPDTEWLALLRLMEFLLITGGTALAIRRCVDRRLKAAAVPGLAAIATSLFLVKRIRRANFSWRSNLFSILGLPIFSYLLLRSSISYKAGAVMWKGRKYGPKSSPSKGNFVISMGKLSRNAPAAAVEGME